MPTSTPPAGRDPLTGALTDLTADQLIDADEDLTPRMADFLAAGGYGSIKEWAEDNDLYYEDLSGEWYSNAGPFGYSPPPVDLYGKLGEAADAACIRYQIVTLRVPFDPSPSDSTDAQGDRLPGQRVPSEWDWTDLTDTPDTVVLDCDPVSEDPDVQMIERLLDEDLNRCTNQCVCTRVEKVASGELDVWSEDPDHSRSAWQYEVSNGDTNQGYWEWCDLQAEDDDNPANQDDGERRCEECSDSYNVADHGGADDNGYCMRATCQAVAGDPS